MKHQEKKYRVNDFASIEDKLAALGVKQVVKSSSTHYYAPQPTNDVVKLVEYSDRCEIHKLKEDSGKFTLTQKISLRDLEEGLGWLRDQGYQKVAVVTMRHADYEYRGGTVGLYVLNDLFHSVILDLPGGQHSEAAKVLGLEDAEAIEVPYNKYLEQLGRLELVDIATL